MTTLTQTLLGGHRAYRAALSLLLIFAAAVPAAGGSPGSANSAKPDSVLALLAGGNRRFAAGRSAHPHSDRMRIRDTGLHGQHPIAAILCCADSRVTPELIFDQGLGDLFTIRVAGNVANEDEMASIEYSVQHLSVPVCIVMGHTGCGAVSAVVHHERLPQSFDHLLAPVRSVVARIESDHPDLPHETVESRAVRANIWQSMSDLLRKNPGLRDSVRTGRLRLVGALYDTRRGTVHWMGAHPRQRELLHTRPQPAPR